MQAAGLFTLPQKTQRPKATQKKHRKNARTADNPLAQFASITLQKTTQQEDVHLWNELIDRYHYLGYRRPMGTHLRYFIVAQSGTEEKQKLGCLSFSFPVWSLACRDQWIGWNERTRKQRLNLILNNNRFLILPWINIKNLASYWHDSQASGR